MLTPHLTAFTIVNITKYITDIEAEKRKKGKRKSLGTEQKYLKIFIN